MAHRDADAELDRQARTLHELGYAALAGVSGDTLEERVVALRGPARRAWTERVSGHLPFVVVVTADLVATTAAVDRWVVRGQHGWTDMADELADYRPIEGVALPGEAVYLLADVDTGAGTLNVRPDDALPLVRGSGRTPLTIDEGVAVVTHHSSVFTEHNAFQALGSRAANKRVPSFWMSRGAPRLGWCWAGNPHSWLGAASAGSRQGSG